MEKTEYTLLVADDEPGIVQLLVDNFDMQGYRVITASDGAEVLKKISRNPDLILLDIAMPGLDGFEVCRRIRDHVSCPIIFLTAKVAERDRIKGLSIGGDDYILKPFSIDELSARVAAHLRREERKQKDADVKIFGDLAVHYKERSLYYKNVPIELPKMEFDIIELLSLNPNQVFSKEQIYEEIKGFDGEGDATIIAEHIRRIRNHLAQAIKNQYIDTVWGVGYKWIG